MSEDSVTSRSGHFEMTSDTYTRGNVRGHEIKSDESEPFGDAAHPSPVDYMLTSLATCQMAVLSRGLEKARIDEYRIEVNAETVEQDLGDVDDTMPEETAKRIPEIDIELTLEVPDEYTNRAERVLDVYDEGCVVGQSFKAGIHYEPETNIETTD